MGVRVFFLIVVLWIPEAIAAYWLADPGEFWKLFAVFVGFGTAAAVGNYLIAKIYERRR